MKRLFAALVIGLLFSLVCFAQTQDGDASYNASKSGLIIAHSSMSFGTRVRVTNLRNNKEVIATVDGRIPTSDPRIADISREAGDAIGMPPSGYTRVRLEQLVHEQAAPVPAPAAPIPAPQAGSRVSPPASLPPPAPPVPPAPARQEPRIEETIQVVSQPPQYLIAPAQVQQTCFAYPLWCVAGIILLVLIFLILAVILVLLLRARSIPWWPWRYPLWIRRRFRYRKRRLR
jgi:hypothetical protein